MMQKHIFYLLPRWGEGGLAGEYCISPLWLHFLSCFFFVCFFSPCIVEQAVFHVLLSFPPEKVTSCSGPEAGLN